MNEGGGFRVLVLAGAGVVLGLGLVTSAIARGELPPPAQAAVRTLFPEAEVTGVHRETEGGVSYYEVAVRNGDERIEIEVTADGAVGEVETVMTFGELPQAVRDGILQRTAAAQVHGIERHEIRGVPRGDTFASLDPPLVAYEISYEVDGVRREERVGADGSLLPAEPTGEDADDDSAEDDDADD